MIKYLSLFSGIGAFEKAMINQDIPFELVGYSEIDKYASKSYSEIFDVPETMNFGDITKIDEKELGEVDFITYGFPCQDISLSGKQKGLFECECCHSQYKLEEKDIDKVKKGQKLYCDVCGSEIKQTRSGLFFDALRIIKETKPAVAIAENVKNLTSKKFNAEFQIVLGSLEEDGYNNYWKILNSKDYGIPQNRERVFIVSIRKDLDHKRFRFPEPYPLKLRLKDMLEETVDEKYFLSDDKIKHIEVENIKELDSIEGCLVKNKGAEFVRTTDVCGTLLARDYKGLPNTPATAVCVKVGNRNPSILVDEPKMIQVGQLWGTEREPNPQAERVYDSDGIYPTLSVGGSTHQPHILVREATKKGYAEAVEGDSVNLEQPNSTTRRGRVGHQIAQTLTTSCNQGVITNEIKVLGNYSPSGHDASRIVSPDGIAPTVKENHGTVTATVTEQLRIRKLTPKECFRLQGFSDSDFEKLSCSNTQAYKQAGNSITVDVAEELLCMLFDEDGNFYI